MSEAEKKATGRRPLPPGERAEVVSVRLKPEQVARFRALGGVEWLRAALHRARLPK